VQIHLGIATWVIPVACRIKIESSSLPYAPFQWSIRQARAAATVPPGGGSSGLPSHPHRPHGGCSCSGEKGGPEALGSTPHSCTAAAFGLLGKGQRCQTPLILDATSFEAFI